MTIATANGARQRTPTDGLSQATRAAALAARVGTWVRDEEANALERAPVMGADDRPNLTATDHSMWHPVELTHASERQRDQLPNHALLDQGCASGGAGPASASRAQPWRPARGARRAALPQGTQVETAHTGHWPVRARPSSALTIFQLVGTASMAPVGGASDRPCQHYAAISQRLRGEGGWI